MSMFQTLYTFRPPFATTSLFLIVTSSRLSADAFLAVDDETDADFVHLT